MKTSSPTHPSRQLVLRARRGNSQAIAELYTRFWRAARTAAYATVRGFSTAEHVAGDAFRDAAAGLATLREPDRFAPWLRRIVRRKAPAAVERPLPGACCGPCRCSTARVRSGTRRVR